MSFKAFAFGMLESERTRTPIWSGSVQPVTSYGCSGGPPGHSSRFG